MSSCYSQYIQIAIRLTWSDEKTTTTTQHRPKQPNKMFPFLVNSVLLFFFFLFRSNHHHLHHLETRNAHDTESKQRSRLGSIYTNIFFLLRNIYSLCALLSLLAQPFDGFKKKYPKKIRKLLCSFFTVAVLFALSTRTRIQQRRIREWEKKYPSQTRTFSWYLWIITTQWKKYDGREKIDRMKRKKKQHNIDRVAYSTVG